MKIKLTTGKTLTAAPGQSVLEALKSQGIYLVASCGGKGVCGKCRIRVLEGELESEAGKLTPDERASGLAPACRSFPKGDVAIEIPESSRLVVGDKIALARAAELKALLESFGVSISPVLAAVDLHLPPPTIHDNVGDLERLRRALEEKGLPGVRFSHGFVRSMSGALREHGWKVTLGYTDTPSPEAVFISPENTDGKAVRFGLAVDIGTTTVVACLVDLSDGRLLDVGSTYNSQMRWGDDVITRIVHATEGGGLAELREAVVEDINDLLAAMLDRQGIAPEAVESVAISGNTTMTHLFWGLDPGYIREEPYIPTLNSFPMWRAGTAGVKTYPEAPIYTMPCVASYVGGDIVSGVLASRMHLSDEAALFMDIGTNGEIAIGNSEWLVTAAASAGPCFEGSGIRHGMRATEGAVEGVTIDPSTLEPALKVIGGARPQGICGSGMIDVVSEMFLKGIIDRKGNFASEAGTARIREGDGGPEYVLYEEGRTVVSLTQPDIENLLRAKAAIYAAVSLLLGEVGLALEDIRRVYIAGGFGNYLDVERAVVMGMLPDLPRENFSFLGNTSAAGAYLSLMSRDLRREAEAIASRMTYIELSVSRGFMDEYMSAMFLPHTDISRFPSVEKLIAQK